MASHEGSEGVCSEPRWKCPSCNAVGVCHMHFGVTRCTSCAGTGWVDLRKECLSGGDHWHAWTVRRGPWPNLCDGHNTGRQM
jgi:hypothetical protein